MMQRGRETIEELDPDRVGDRFLDFLGSFGSRATFR